MNYASLRKRTGPLRGAVCHQREASLINIIWRSDGPQFLVSFIGVIAFTGLTAYDAQRLRAMALALPFGRTGSYAIVGALTLYLDFINLFLMMLRFMGHRRD